MFVAGAGGSEESDPVPVGRNQPDEGRETRTAQTSWSRSKYIIFLNQICHIILNRWWINEPFAGFLQSSDAVSGSDGSLDAAKMAELDSRLAAQTAETERLKVCEHFTLIFIQQMTSLKVFILLIICIYKSSHSTSTPSTCPPSPLRWFRRRQRARRRPGRTWSSSWLQPPARWPSCRRRNQSCRRRCKSPRRNRTTCWCCWQTRTRRSTAWSRDSKTSERRYTNDQCYVL